MTWTTPQPDSSGTPALLPPGPLTLGEIAGGSWRVYKARFGLFLKLLIMPFLIMFAVTVGFALTFVAVIAANPRGVEQSFPALVALIIGFYVALLVVSLLTYVYQGRTVIAGIDLATGRANPTSTNLAERTRGMLGRVVILMLLGLAFGLVVGIGFFLVMVPIVLAAGQDGGSGAGVGALIGMLLMVAVNVALIWFSIKITYIIPAMAEEGQDAIAAIRRSFELTKGAFWRTFGYQVVLGLIAMALLIVPYFIAIGAIVAGVNARGEAATGGAFLGMGFGILLMYAVMILFVPYSYVYTALMYLGRGRELSGAATGHPYPPQDPYAAQRSYPPQDQQYPPNPWTSPSGDGSTPQA